MGHSLEGDCSSSNHRMPGEVRVIATGKIITIMRTATFLAGQRGNHNQFSDRVQVRQFKRRPFRGGNDLSPHAIQLIPHCT